MARPGLTQHRKFRRLARQLGSNIVARGALELLWEACYEAGEDYVGTSDDIENLVGWNGEKGMLTRALVDAGVPEGHGFIEPVATTDATGPVAYRVHDLWHHAPDYVGKRRKRELERQQRTGPSHDSRSAPNGAASDGSQDCLIGIDRTPSPSPAPSHSPVQELSRTGPSADALVDLWNQLVTPPIPKVTKLTSDRRSKLNARLKSYPDLETWRTVIGWLNGQDWCRAPGDGAHPNWTATLDWLCKTDGNVQRWLERAITTTRRAPTRPTGCRHNPACRDAAAHTQRESAERRMVS